ncbi:hypothetical protein [Xanthomonas theicola]|uniref:Uncharacterized protein n=1 Tax=Xanthomonas theicola TaxID=56464 RepID=A0A2S6ZDC3_9XANT|nr:hypothetical protein [Xanthomonas theicola]PPT90277.1 hypothetical protein XthCFBP4691_13235 [Xanthomonas theicola]QNH26208.1 hypothetical protein G4Q83_17730 [Xanthomonas theicola]
MRAGGRCVINLRRIIELPGEADTVWTDVMTRRCYKLPAEMMPLLDRLSASDRGVDMKWLARHDETQRSRMRRLMCQLASREAIRSCV